MAKITIAGDAVVITSSLKLDDIRTIEKYRPKELILKGDDDEKEPIFAIGTTESGGKINAVGVSFDSITHDDAALACVTMFTNAEENVKEWVADRIGRAMINLNKLEGRLPTVLEEIKEEKAAVLSSITIVQ